MNVCALLVTYYPCKDKIQHIFTSITAQVKHILVVDNTPDEIWDITSNCNKHQYTMLKNNGNIGLSKAQNIGIQWAIEHGYVAKYDLELGMRASIAFWRHHLGG